MRNELMKTGITGINKAFSELAPYIANARNISITVTAHMPNKKNVSQTVRLFRNGSRHINKLKFH